MKSLSLPLVLVASLMLAACAGGNRDVGINDAAQDEFRVITKAPLTVPPDYRLRPPTPGQALPAEVDPARRGNVTAFGEGFGQDASASERALVAAARANAVNPAIRAQVDFEQARMIRKSTGDSDSILGWTGTEEEREAAATDNATGGDPVTLGRPSTSTLKLPGT